MEELHVSDLIRQQHARRLAERAKINQIAASEISQKTEEDNNDNGNNEDEKENVTTATMTTDAEAENKKNEIVVTENATESKNSQEQEEETATRNLSTAAAVAASATPTSLSASSPLEEVTVIANLKSRITVLENESEQLRAVVDLSRKESAVLRDVLGYVAQKSLGMNWKSDLKIDLNRLTSLEGIGNPAVELTYSQRERLISLLEGEELHLLPP